jgi:uncharacterized protein YrrD
MIDAQTTLVRASDVSGLPVVTIDGGDDVAEIKDVVYEGASHTLVGFTLNKRGWFRGSMKEVLVAGSVEAIGRNAVMVATESAISAGAHQAADSPGASGGLDPKSGRFAVVGNTVMSSAGVALGKVVDVIIETGTDPNAVGYEVATDDGSIFVPSSAQMALSGQNLIVPAESEQFVRNDLAGFGASVASFRGLINSADDSEERR